MKQVIRNLLFISVLVISGCKSQPKSSTQTPDSSLFNNSSSTIIGGDSSSSSNIPISNAADYYSTISSSLTGTTLKNALYEKIKVHHIPYTYDNCDSYIANANEDPNNSNNVILFYTGRSVLKTYQGATASAPDGWNKEHVWAKSHGSFATQVAGRDIHHLMPTDNGVNNTRSSKDFDTGGSLVLTYNSYGQKITVEYADPNDQCKTTTNTFEPRDVVKGDVARIMFYMAVRYEGKSDGGPNLELVDSITGNNATAPTLGKLSTLLQWHLADPVDEFEMTRNNYIYNLQGNRNPFIDHPDFAAKIWG